MDGSKKDLLSDACADSAILGRAAPRRGYCLSSAAPAAARDRDRSRRPARPGRAAATVLVVGLLLVGAAAAEAQTERILVSNAFQTADDSANTSGNDHAQLFHTGAHPAGYTLTSVIVNSDDAEDDDFDVEICGADTTADEFPTTDCTALTAPASFVGVGNVPFEHAGLALSANTNYVVVIKQRGTGSVEIDSTTSSGEDSQGLSDWSIKNKFYWKSGSTWMIKSGSNEALTIIVYGYETPAVTVTDATLSALSVSGATLSPAFAAATTDYSMTVANAVSQVTITATTSESTATIEYLDGSDATRTDADTMTAGLQVNLSVGSNIVKVKVTAPDTTTTKTYTVNVLRGAVPATCSVASMQNQVWTANLTVGTATLLGTPIYGWNDGGGYTGASLTDEDFTFAGDTYDLEEIWVGGGLLTLAFNTTNPGDIATQATRNKLTFHVGSDSFNLGTGSLGSTQRTIVWSNVGLSWAASDSVCLALTEEVASTDATLSALALSGVTLSPAFDADTETYTASVANSVATTTVTAMATDAGATVAVTPSTDADAVTSGHQVNLGVGPTTITATVTAEDGMTTKTYTVVVTRAQTCTVPSGGIWGACLTAATISSGSTFDASLPLTGLGCLTTSCGDTSVLTSRDFSFGGKNYRIEAVDLRGGTLEFNLVTPNANTAAAEFSSVVLHVGTLSYSLASASFVGNSEAFAWTNTGLSWSANDKIALQLVDLASTNAPPAFSAATATRSVPENSPASTNVGAPVTATDGDNDPLAYSLEGTAAATFEIVSTSGQIRTTAGETYDRETQSSYAVTVKADDGNGGTDTIAVTITLTNVIEPPGRPAAPSVSSVAGSTPSLSVTWTAPSNTGPAIEDYDLEYRQGTSGSWTNGPQDVSGTSTTISGLTANTLYEVQVLATNAEGNSPWSPSGSGQTNTAGNSAPTFANSVETRSVAENSAAGTNVGAPVTANDTDSGDTLTYTLEGTDAASFDIVSTTGQIRTRSGVTYDHEAQPSYTVIVKADDGNGGTDTVTVTIELTDVDEPPRAPAAPRVTATPDTTDSLTVSWSAPSNTGRPAIEDYDLQYREGTSGNWTNGPQGVSGTSATIAGLTAARTAYQVQVRATNADGAGDWSPPGRIRTTPPPPAVGPPSPPRGLTATAGDRAVQLSWRRPAEDGGARIGRYEYRQREGDGPFGAWQIIGEDPPPTDHTVTGLMNGVSYTFEVRAVNSRHASPPSETASATPEPEREPFEVDIVGVPDVAVAGESYELTAQSDAEEALVYAWRVAYGEGGSVEPTDTQTVVWTAPSGVNVAWIRVDATREDGATAGQSVYVRVEVPEPEPEPEPEPVPALPLLGQLLLASLLLGAGRFVIGYRRPQR